MRGLTRRGVWTSGSVFHKPFPRKPTSSVTGWRTVCRPGPLPTTGTFVSQFHPFPPCRPYLKFRCPPSIRSLSVDFHDLSSIRST